MDIVVNNQKRLVILGGNPRVLLNPGPNRVNSARWAKAKESKAVRAMLTEKLLSEIGAVAEDNAYELEKLDASEAIARIWECLKKPDLVAWEKAEKALAKPRRVVLEAIAIQIDKITVKPSADKAKK